MPSRTILHVDMDAFYAAVEQRDRPALRGRPIIIGADPRGGAGRGVVSTASYEARRFGVRSAMPISQAYRLCPQGVYLVPDMEKYSAVSEQVMAIVRSLTDRVEPVSIDEAFVDVSDARRTLGSGEAAARRLKGEIRSATGLTASVGVASSKLVAKVASDLEKPDGLVVVVPGSEQTFLAPLPVRRLWGVGPKMEERLLKAGVHTLGDLADLAPTALERRFGTHGYDLQLLARGIDDRPVVSDPGEAKSVGQEHTFDADTAEVDRLRRTLLDLADGVARRLRSQGLRGRTVTLKYRDETFRTLTRASTLTASTDASDLLFQTAWQLFGRVHGRLRVRLLGIYASGFGAGSAGGKEQLGLFDPSPSPADQLRDAITERFGRDALTRASLLGRRERRHPESEMEAGDVQGDRTRRKPGHR
jgi:nucleotidyltransferase/DNA polymerase involved in DNA repair